MRASSKIVLVLVFFLLLFVTAACVGDVASIPDDCWTASTAKQRGDMNAYIREQQGKNGFPAKLVQEGVDGTCKLIMGG